MRTTLLITGMRDNAGRERVLEALESVAGVERVAVNLFRARAAVQYVAPCEPRQLISAVRRTGCEAALAGPSDLIREASASEGEQR